MENMMEKRQIPKYIKLNTTLDADLIKLIDLVLKKYRAVRFDYYNNKISITVYHESKLIIGLAYDDIEDDYLFEIEYVYIKGNNLFVRERVKTKYHKNEKFRKTYRTTEYPYKLLRMIKEPDFKSRVLKALLEDEVENGDSIQLGSHSLTMIG